jgi:hypothetical protein
MPRAERPEEDNEGNYAEQEALAKLQGMSLDGILRAGLEASLRLLVAKVIAGTASASVLAVLRNMLRDNGMVMNKMVEGDAVKPLPLPTGDDIPHLPAPDYSD